MIWKLLLYPVAFIVDHISNVCGAILSQHPIVYRIELFLLTPRLNNQEVSTTVSFLIQMIRMFFIRFFTSIGGIVILALWGHKYSWQIFLAFLIVRERFFNVALYNSEIPWFYPACLIGAWLGLALLAFLTAVYT